MKLGGGIIQERKKQSLFINLKVDFPGPVFRVRKTYNNQIHVCSIYGRFSPNRDKKYTFQFILIDLC